MPVAGEYVVVRSGLSVAEGGVPGARSGDAREVGLVSVSLDLGAGRRGVDMGPSAIRIAGLGAALGALGYGVREVGAVTAPGPETASIGEVRTRFLPEIAQTCQQTYQLVREAVDGGCFPLILGGDHALSAGTVSASGFRQEIAADDETTARRMSRPCFANAPLHQLRRNDF